MNGWITEPIKKLLKLFVAEFLTPVGIGNIIGIGFLIYVNKTRRDGIWADIQQLKLILNAQYGEIKALELLQTEQITNTVITCFIMICIALSFFAVYRYLLRHGNRVIDLLFPPGAKTHSPSNTNTQ